MMLKAIFGGKVQGVFFRAAVKEYAEELGLVGYAKNLDDGSVEIKAIGKKADLKKFINKIRKKPGGGEIYKEEIKFKKSNVTYESFEIK